MTQKQQFYTNVLGIGVEEFEPNPKVRHDSREDDKQAYMVRAICKVLDKEWSDVYKDLFSTGIESGLSIADDRNVEKYLSQYGYTRYKNKSFNGTISEFMYNHKNGKYVICGDNYAVAYIDGAIYDNYTVFYNSDHFLISRFKEVYSITELSDRYLIKYENGTMLLNISGRDDIIYGGYNGKMIKFVVIDALPDQYEVLSYNVIDYRRMNDGVVDKFKNSELFKWLNTDCLNMLAGSISDRLIEYPEGGYIRLPNIVESIFYTEPDSKYFNDLDNRFETNSLQPKQYWLENKFSDDEFYTCSWDGKTHNTKVTNTIGVRIRFKMKKTKLF